MLHGLAQASKPHFVCGMTIKDCVKNRYHIKHQISHGEIMTRNMKISTTLFRNAKPLNPLLAHIKCLNLLGQHCSCNLASCMHHRLTFRSHHENISVTHALRLILSTQTQKRLPVKDCFHLHVWRYGNDNL